MLHPYTNIHMQNVLVKHHAHGERYAIDYVGLTSKHTPYTPNTIIECMIVLAVSMVDK